MKDGSIDCQCISRRVVLTSTVLAFGAAAATMAVSQAEAQQKISQEDAKYQGTPEGPTAVRWLHQLPIAECV
jgi:hypothetical protein